MVHGVGPVDADQASRWTEQLQPRDLFRLRGAAFDSGRKGEVLHGPALFVDMVAKRTIFQVDTILAAPMTNFR